MLLLLAMPGLLWPNRSLAQTTRFVSTTSGNPSLAGRVLTYPSSTTLSGSGHSLH